LLPGPLHVFMDNFFVTTSELKSTSPGAAFELYLGVDDSIKLEFIANDKTGTAGVIKKAKTAENQHITTITNNRQNQIRVFIFDQIPQPSDQSIKIKVLEPTIAEPGKGLITYTLDKNLKWGVDIAPNETKVLKLTYVLEWPKDKDIELRTQ